MPLRAGSGHRVPRRAGQPRAEQRPVLPGVRGRVHERGEPGERGLPGHRGPRRAVLRLRPGEAHYDQESWQYEPEDSAATASRGPAGKAQAQERLSQTEAVKDAKQAEAAGSGGPLHGKGKRDETLQHPRSVFQILKRHFARYTPEMVAEVCGIEPEVFLKVAEWVTANSGRERTTAWVYSVGWTQHTVGAQYIRTASILQALLGNIGRPGGGIGAARAREHPGLDRHPDAVQPAARLPADAARPPARLARRVLRRRRRHRWLLGQQAPYMVSLLKAWWGDAAQPENDFCFDYLPRIDGDHSSYRTVSDMIAGKVPGYFLVGENPAVGHPNARMNRLGLANLEWLVVRDLQEIESASFWYDAPEIETGELVTDQIATEVFLMPAASHVEKEGTFTQTQRMLQWRDKAVEPPGDARSDLWFYYHLGRILRERLKDSTDPRDRPLLDLTWDYLTHGETADPDAEAVLREINGTGPDGRALSSYMQMKDGLDDGGCWIYCGVYADEVNQAARRKPRQEQNEVAPEWGWAWPLNRRILYNRASADPAGRPWSERKKYVWWDEEAGRWTGEDVPDFEARSGPTTCRRTTRAQDAIGGADPFVMQSDGKAWLFAPKGVVDGPLPAHYEPAESPVDNPLYVQSNPTKEEIRAPWNRTHAAQRRLPVRVHHLPADRAPHGRGDEPHAAVPGGAAAGVLRGGLAAAGRGAGLENGGWATVWPGRAWSGAGDGADASAAAQGRGGSCTRSASRTTGAEGGLDRRLGQRPAGRHPRPEHPHPGEQGLDVRHPAGTPSARAGAAGVPGGVPPAGRDAVRRHPGGRPGAGGDRMTERPRERA